MKQGTAKEKEGNKGKQGTASERPGKQIRVREKRKHTWKWNKVTEKWGKKPN